MAGRMGQTARWSQSKARKGPDLALFQSWLRERITHIDPDHPVEKSYQCHTPPPQTSSPD